MAAEDIKYRGLEKRKSEIRLLDVHPAARLDDPLRGTLRQVALYNASFKALSYSWGKDPTDNSVITIKVERTGLGGLFSDPDKTYEHPITGNLSRALRHLRRNDADVTLWSDNICINQKDKTEKSWQVDMMGSVYSRAREVLAWLGPEHRSISAPIDTHISAAFGLAEKIWGLAKRIVDLDRLDEKTWLELCVTLANSDSEPGTAWSDFSRSLRSDVQANRSIMEGLLAVDVLSCSTYFSRVWILQESGRAAKLTFHYGLRSISHRPLLLLLSLTYSLHKLRRTIHPTQTAYVFDARFLRCLIARVTCSKRTPLLDVLKGEFHSPAPLHDASNLRDLVYARRGLSVDPDSINGNYNSSVSEVFTTTSRFLLRGGFMKPLIAFKPYAFMQWDSLERLPSWAHDWSKMGISIFENYDAARNTYPNVSYTPYSKYGFKHAIKMKGINVGKVRTVNSRFSTIAAVSELSKGAILAAEIRSDSLSSEMKKTLASRVKSAYEQLDLARSNSALKFMFSNYSFPFAPFWCWWVYWVISLTKMIEEAEDVHVQGTRSMDVAELILRDQPRNIRLPLKIGQFETRENLLTLLDIKNWPSSSQNDSSNPTSGAQSAMAVYANILFRSAWGMRCAILDTGRIGYVPEDAELQDQVVIFHGVQAPLVLRKTTDDAYRIIGPAHICGVMEGQVIRTGLPVDTYTLV